MSQRCVSHWLCSALQSADTGSMTVFPTCNLHLRPDPASGSLLIEWSGYGRLPAVPEHLLARSAVLHSLRTATEGSASMPFPLGCLENYSQYVTGLGPVDWLLNSMKVIVASARATVTLRKRAAARASRTAVAFVSCGARSLAVWFDIRACDGSIDTSSPCNPCAFCWICHRALAPPEAISANEK